MPSTLKELKQKIDRLAASLEDSIRIKEDRKALKEGTVYIDMLIRLERRQLEESREYYNKFK